MKEKPVKVIYKGKRQNGDTVNDCFEYKKKDLYFSGRTFVTIGHYYEAFETKDGIKMAKFPKHLGESELTEDQLEEYRMQSTLAEEFAHHRRMRHKLNKNQKLLYIIDELKPIAKNLTFKEQRMLVEHIVDELDKTFTQEIRLKALAQVNKAKRVYRKSENKK